MLSGWLKNLTPLFKSIILAQNKPHFHHVSSKLQVIDRNSDRFITQFAPAVIGQSNYFGTESLLWNWLSHLRIYCFNEPPLTKLTSHARPYCFPLPGSVFLVKGSICVIPLPASFLANTVKE